MEKAAVGTISNLVDDIGFKVNVEGTGNVFPRRGFREEGAEPVATGIGNTFHQTAVGLIKGFVRKNTHSTRSVMKYSH